MEFKIVDARIPRKVAPIPELATRLRALPPGKACVVSAESMGVSPRSFRSYLYIRPVAHGLRVSISQGDIPGEFEVSVREDLYAQH